ncbi:alpha-glucosidase [Levilactobacillus zymae]|uniref:Alpha-glucosidase n=1 Tax=Levilactobacillus zymae TaxID=267363 RepID=A0ABQ0WUH3_9LACO|nr:alpha-glucosidase [Levilactobacillus zymae]KRL11289.1 alpha-glucosidase [Levilactobacillus zymae DSM 19395]QFR60179.1 alpha-glucosidase [Levilactobacillus zymae]GEO71378.1 alpha-glucosidase [Levilactobacillus zymae]
MQITLDHDRLTLQDLDVEDDWQLNWMEQSPAILHSTVTQPAIAVGEGRSHVTMDRGNFQLTDTPQSKIGLPWVRRLTQASNTVQFELAPTPSSPSYLRLNLHYRDAGWHLDFTPLAGQLNRFWCRLLAQPTDRFYGGGEQFSAFDLAGRQFPIWTSEPGVGRNKQTAVTQAADRANGGGGDYYTTNYPQATYLTSRHQLVHLATTAYAVLDFRDQRFTELSAWAIPAGLWLGTAPTLADTVKLTKAWFGTQPSLPDWLVDGVVLGLQGGTTKVTQQVTQAQQAGVRLAGVWTQDWVGPLTTSFGQRLHWDWHLDSQIYPGWSAQVKRWRQRGIHYLGYVNPYLIDDGPLFQTAAEQQYLVRTAADQPYLVDFGEFNCGMVDLLNPAAYRWYVGVLADRLVAGGMSGWMADFGEYLPADAHLFGKADPLTAHNRWPVLWAKLNHDVLQATGTTGEVVPFFRSGGAGTQRYAPLLWAGDQSSDWSVDDGLPAALTGMLTAGLTGNGLTHSDIGGYTSLYGVHRSKELWLRWLELAAFTPVMRTHEGNRPAENFQPGQDTATLRQLARMTRLHHRLGPYLRRVMQENTVTGLPVMRPVMLSDENDPELWQEHTSFTLGPDLLVAPVLTPKTLSRTVRLPAGKWVHLWSGRQYTGHQTLTVVAPVGQPPVFYRAGCADRRLFQDLLAFA